MRLLILDDDPTSLILLQLACKDWQYEVEAVSSGAAAWDILRSKDSPPLAIFNLAMNGTSGLELCRRVRQESEAEFIYLILLVQASELEEITNAVELDADDYMTRPLIVPELHMRLRTGQRIVELRQQLSTLAARDSLTGIWNRKAIFEILERELAISARADSAVGVIMADIDHFKAVNDTFGHAAGDAALREIVNRLTVLLRPVDSIGRYDSEGFLVVLPGCGLDGTLAAAERIRHAVFDGPSICGVSDPRLSLSIGLTIAGNGCRDADQLIKVADEALLRAKRHGRNRVEVSPNPEDVFRLDFKHWELEGVL